MAMVDVRESYLVAGAGAFAAYFAALCYGCCEGATRNGLLVGYTGQTGGSMKYWRASASSSGVHDGKGVGLVYCRSL